MSYDHDKAKKEFNNPIEIETFNRILPKVIKEMQQSPKQSSLGNYFHLFGKNIPHIVEKSTKNSSDINMRSKFFIVSEAIFESLKDQNVLSKLAQNTVGSLEDIFDMANFNLARGYKEMTEINLMAVLDEMDN